ncbi:MAG: hypothetical protein A3F11_03300 [Gammaproteobacteria bacterium RIFCSPHIGHO2_12_FULL_37_14]|nr:MAG: hypothetical protein A3F11_03300 [Gammaproteobacteria bacterium RIFCSPHIGHO2_12_FULL_37_14]
MLIGIDLDHTIIDYGDAFYSLALERGLINSQFRGTKTELREHLRLQPEGHEQWMRLQGYVYGKGMNYAKIMPGFIHFIQLCRHNKIKTVIVSHKTEYGHYDPDKIDLRKAALKWMEVNGFFDATLSFNKNDIFFELTQEEKIARITALGCTLFIDDLIDIFIRDDFPQSVKTYLLNKEKNQNHHGKIEHCLVWDEVTQKIFP